jgi:major membrane immunogen (membrane-anchored lipoprotein)
MKKIIAILAVLTVAASAFAGSWADGMYFAQEDEFAGNGWKYNVTITVDNGRITEANWNGTNVAGGPDKKTASKTGNYPMVERGGAQSDWHVQAEKAEAYLLRTQDPTRISYKDDEGHTDAISGVSIHVIEFFSLAEEALESAPVARGRYRDGYYQAEEAQFAGSGWKYFAQYTVVNGTVVQVNWNGINKDGGDTKKVASKAGNYPMVERGGAQSDWHVQAAVVEDYFLDNRGRAPRFTDDGHTDAIAGASVSVESIFKLADEALRRR